jgi:hypothetical protein
VAFGAVMLLLALMAAQGAVSIYNPS